MNIVWAPNPLRTVVELDDADRTLLRERIKSEEFENYITSAAFALDPGFDTKRTLEQGLAEARRWLDLGHILDDEERHGKTFTQRLDEKLAWCIEELASEHCGDCTCVPSSCLKCHAERLIGIDTTKGLGKHEASKIGGAFRKGKTLEEVIAWLADYRPTWNETWRDRATFDQHVPRWIEEGKRAHAWLVEYRSAHFADVNRTTSAKDK